MFHRKKPTEQPSTLLSDSFARNYKTILIGLVLSLLIATPVMLAQDSTQTADQKCAAEFRTYLSDKGKIFLEAIDKHFQNSSSTTSLIPLATEKYTAYKKMINAQFDLLKSQVTPGGTQASTLAAYSRCEQELDDHLLMIDTVLRDHVKQSSSAKRTYIMTSEYQRINDKMADLNRQVGQLKGYFQVLDSKLENFIPKCVKG